MNTAVVMRGKSLVVMRSNVDVVLLNSDPNLRWRLPGNRGGEHTALNRKTLAPS